MKDKPTRVRRAMTRGLGLLTAALLILWAAGWYGAARVRADTTAPAAPTDLAVTSSGGTVILSWNPSTSGDVDFYHIFRYPGDGIPAADEVTYLAPVDESQTDYVDVVEAEGRFRYAVMAVDAAGNASPSSEWVGTEIDLDDDGTLEVDEDGPAAPADFAADANPTPSQTVDLTWSEPADNDLWRYLLYRADGAEGAVLIAYPQEDDALYTDEVPGDGSYTYTLVPQDATGNLGTAVSAEVVVDTTAPEVEVLTPVDEQSYDNEGDLPITLSITEGGSGVDWVEYFLDASTDPLTSDMIDLDVLSPGSHTLMVHVTDQAGNVGVNEVTFHVLSDTTTTPTAPRNLTAAMYEDDTVELDWTAPQEGSPDRYIIYRLSADGGDIETMLTDHNATSYIDEDVEDGTYVYHVAAIDVTQVSDVSNAVVVMVDTTAPEISIESPEDTGECETDGILDVLVTITDEVSGYDDEDVAISLDGDAFTGDAIDLSDLDEGEHTFRVEVTDRAGNTADESVHFIVGTEDDEDDEGEDEDEHEDDNEDEDDRDLDLDLDDVDVTELTKLLVELRDQIHHGQYVALHAKLRAGKVGVFALHVIKHRGKHISEEAADALLEAMGLEDLDFDPREVPDSLIEGCDGDDKGNHGKGKRGR